MRNLSTSSVGLALMMVLTSSCKGKSDRGNDVPTAIVSASVSSLTVYSGRAEKLIAPAIEAYEEKTGVDVKMKYADSAQLAATLLEEGAASPADVFLAQDASTLAFVAGQGGFVRLPSSVLERVLPAYRASDGMWVGVSGRARVLAYNTANLTPEQLPETAAELVTKRWHGRVGWAPPNASFQSFVAAMLQLEGRASTAAWLVAMKEGGAKYYPKNTPAVMAVSRGEVDVAVVNHYYLYRLREEHGDDFPVANHYFRSNKAASMVNVSGAAVVNSSAVTPARSASAVAFIEYLLSDEGQRHFVAANHEFPAAKGVASPDGLPSINTLAPPTLDIAKLDNLEEAVAVLRETGVLR